MSISGGLDKAIDRAESLDSTAMQIFTKSNQQWHAKPISHSEAIQFKTRLAQSRVQSVVVHASYLINIGASNSVTKHKSTEALAIEVERCALLHIPYLVLHPGAAGKESSESCIERIAKNLDKVLASTDESVYIVLENTAGQGSVVGYSFEQLAAIRAATQQKKRIGICFDTCHAFAAGYDFRTPTTYRKLWEEFDRIIGLEHLKVIHCNDSKKGLNSHVDRHEDIGKGMLGAETFTLLVNDERFFDIPKILETPHESLADDARNLAVMRSFISPKNKKLLNIK